MTCEMLCTECSHLLITQAHPVRKIKSNHLEIKTRHSQRSLLRHLLLPTQKQPVLQTRLKRKNRRKIKEIKWVHIVPVNLTDRSVCCSHCRDVMQSEWRTVTISISTVADYGFGGRRPGVHACLPSSPPWGPRGPPRKNFEILHCCRWVLAHSGMLSGLEMCFRSVSSNACIGAAPPLSMAKRCDYKD